jgi:hypothetical protein
VFTAFALTLVGFLSYVILVVAPEGARKRLLREAEHRASKERPDVLVELLGEVRLLRLAMEKLARQS